MWGGFFYKKTPATHSPQQKASLASAKGAFCCGESNDLPCAIKRQQRKRNAHMGNASVNKEIAQCAELVGAGAKALALVAPKMTTQARQSWIGLPPKEFAKVLEDMVFLSSETNIQKWREEDGVIYFSVTSDGTPGEDWIKRLSSNCFHVGDYAKQVLRSPDFKPTSGVTTEVAVLKGMLFKENDRITKKIRAEADTRKLSKPNAELDCLIREKFTDKEIEAMGLIWIVAMHEPINDSDGNPFLLGASRSDGGRWLNAFWDSSDLRWRRVVGFAFTVSQVSA